MNNIYYAQSNDTMLSPLKMDDIEFVRGWRNDASNNKYLKRIGYITSDRQQEWYKNYIKSKNELIWGIVIDGVDHIVGTVSVYNINKDKKIAEIGRILIGDDRAHGKGIGEKAFLMAIKIVSSYCNIDEYYCFVHPDNIPAYSIYKKIGFKENGVRNSVICGELRMHLDKNTLTTINDGEYSKIVVGMSLEVDGEQFYR